jgi:CDP-glucose 4,6-dehydratase
MEARPKAISTSRIRSRRIAAYLLLGERAADPEVRGRPVNFHPDEPTSVLELVETMVRVSGRPELAPRVLNTATNREYEHLSNQRAKSLGWTPQYSLEEGLRETLEWYRDRGGTELEAAAHRFSIPPSST